MESSLHFHSGHWTLSICHLPIQHYCVMSVPYYTKSSSPFIKSTKIEEPSFSPFFGIFLIAKKCRSSTLSGHLSSNLAYRHQNASIHWLSTTIRNVWKCWFLEDSAKPSLPVPLVSNYPKSSRSIFFVPDRFQHNSQWSSLSLKDLRLSQFP